MTSGLALIFIVAGGYVAARLGVRVLARRFLIVAGAEYLLLGILLGPQASGLISANAVDSFGPFITLAIGWMGAAVGAEFHLVSLLRISGSAYQTALLEALLTLAVVGAVLLAVFVRLLGEPLGSAIAPAAVLGAVAVTTSASGIALAARRLAREHASGAALLGQLRVSSGMDAVVGIVAFGLLLCLVHAAPPSDVRPPTPTEWAVITVAIGVVGGIVYHLFLAGERNADRLFIALAAAITLASGTAAYARLSPLLPTMLIGAILVNTSRARREIAAVIHRVHRPLYLVLLVFAGAAWRPSERAWLVPIVCYLVVRPLAKVGSARLAARLSGTTRRLGPDWGYGLVGQGSLAVAIALNYRLLDNSVLPNIVFTAAVISVLLTDLMSARLVQATVQRHRRRHAEPASDPTPAEGADAGAAVTNTGGER